MTRILALLAVLVVGCSPSAIVTHARTARIVAPVLTAAEVLIHDARAAELDACESAPVPAACLDAGEARWAPGVAAYNLTRAAYVAWTDGMSLMLLSQADDTEVSAYLWPLALGLLRLYQGIVEALAPIEGLELPALPDLSVLGGGE